MLLTVPIIWCINHGNYQMALGLFFLAGCSDGADGFLARRFGWVTRLGKALDPLSDKILLTGIIVMLALHGDVPLWLMVLAMSRDVGLILGYLVYRYLLGDFEVRALAISKLNTLMQILLVLLVLADKSGVALPALWLDVVIYVTGATILFSAIAYVHYWHRRRF